MKLIVAALSVASLAACAVQNDTPIPGTHIAPVVTPIVMTTASPLQPAASATSSPATPPAASGDSYMTITEAPTYDAEGRNTDSISVKLY